MQWILPMTRRGGTRETITCYDDHGKPKKHGLEQRYISPTTGVCRKLVVQAVHPSASSEVSIKEHISEIGKVALFITSNNPFRGWIILRWIGACISFYFRLFLPALLFLAFLALLHAGIYVGPDGDDDNHDDESDDAGPFNTGYYKPYARKFQGQLWAARSAKEYSSRIVEVDTNIPTHTLYPKLLVILNKETNVWEHCTDQETIICTRFIAISYRAIHAFTRGPEEENEKAQFTEEVRATVLDQGFEAYWLDIECIGETPAEKNRDLYCMADVYRGAEVTLIMLGKVGVGGKEREKECWKDWGGRVWTMPEALLSARLRYKFRDQTEVKQLSLHELANLAYTHNDIEKAIINTYSRNDLLEKMEGLTLLKSAIWQRSTATLPNGSNSLERSDTIWGAYRAEKVYALMGFFDHRIQPNQSEDDPHALARLCMANDKDRIVERMASMLPSNISPTACWYVDDDIYNANLWDILPEIQVAGVTKNGALVLDGCRAAAIRWKDFPKVAFTTPNSIRRTVIGYTAYLPWFVLIAGLGVIRTNRTAEITLVVIGAVLLIISPLMIVYSQSGRIASVQPWLIGVKGVISKRDVEKLLYGGKRHIPPMNYTPSGSEFSTAEDGQLRGGSSKQYDDAMAVNHQPGTGQVYTLIDTHSATMYYFKAERPPTVCIFAGREGGLGRFVLCSERCGVGELHKESVMQVYVHKYVERLDAYVSRLLVLTILLWKSSAISVKRR